MGSDKKESPHSLKHLLPPMRKISLRVLLVVAVLCLVLPLFRPLNWLAEPGPSSRAHAEIASDCGACHSKPFFRVSDESCESCHRMTVHGEKFARRTGKLPDAENRCASCHMEHTGAHGMLVNDSRQCTSCHANLQAGHKSADVKDVGSLASHVEFQLPKMDKAAIKLNHKVHLAEGIQGAEGKVTLVCGDCHKLSADFKTIEPVSFEKNCRSCHSLAFDPRLPGKEVPHGDADLVLQTLYATYAQLALQGPQAFVEVEPETIGRERPGESPELRKAPPPPPKLDKAYVLKAARSAERDLFEHSACYLCHEMTPVKLDTPEDTVHSLYSVNKPKIPKTWMKHARFNHGSHEELQCESCHAKAAKSEKTADVLLPQIKDCQQCHADSRSGGKIASDCSMCHSYHDSLPLMLDKKKTFAEVLHGGGR